MGLYGAIVSTEESTTQSSGASKRESRLTRDNCPHWTSDVMGVLGAKPDSTAGARLPSCSTLTSFSFPQTLVSECCFFKFPIYITNPLRSRNLCQMWLHPTDTVYFLWGSEQSSRWIPYTSLPHAAIFICHFLYSLEDHGLENTRYTESFLIWWHPIYNQPRSLAKSPKPHSILGSLSVKVPLPYHQCAGPLLSPLAVTDRQHPHFNSLNDDFRAKALIFVTQYEWLSSIYFLKAWKIE